MCFTGWRKIFLRTPVLSPSFTCLIRLVLLVGEWGCRFKIRSRSGGFCHPQRTWTLQCSVKKERQWRVRVFVEDLPQRTWVWRKSSQNLRKGRPFVLGLGEPFIYLSVLPEGEKDFLFSTFFHFAVVNGLKALIDCRKWHYVWGW